MSPGLAAALVLIAACDALTFTEISAPPAGTPRGTVLSTYVQTDSLRGMLQVILDARVTPGADPAVRFDGQTIPATQQQGSYVLFTHAWALAVGEREGFPQVVQVHASDAETDAGLDVPLPVLLRDGPATVCVGADDLVLAFVMIPGSGDLRAIWRLSVDSGFEVVSLQGSGAPPDSIQLPREFLGTVGPWTARLDISLGTDPRGEPDPVTQSAHAAVQWTFVAEESGDPACAATGRAVDPGSS